MSNKIIHIAKDLLNINDDLEFRLDYKRDPKATIDEFEVHIFEQVWGSTALGFGGIGGQSITAAYTYVFVPQCCDQNCFVYFDGSFAYEAEYNSIFKEDLLNRNMKPCNQAGKYRKEYKE